MRSVFVFAVAAWIVNFATAFEADENWKRPVTLLPVDETLENQEKLSQQNSINRENELKREATETPRTEEGDDSAKDNGYSDKLEESDKKNGVNYLYWKAVRPWVQTH